MTEQLRQSTDSSYCLTPTPTVWLPFRQETFMSQLHTGFQNVAEQISGHAQHCVDFQIMFPSPIVMEPDLSDLESLCITITVRRQTRSILFLSGQIQGTSIPVLASGSATFEMQAK